MTMFEIQDVGAAPPDSNKTQKKVQRLAAAKLILLQFGACRLVSNRTMGREGRMKLDTTRAR